MSAQNFQEIPGDPHPINLASYTPDTIPATMVSQEEAEFWAQELSKTHRLEGVVIPIANIRHTAGSMTIRQLIQYTEGAQRNRHVAGKTIIGPAVLQDEVLVSGIGFWAPLEESNQDV